jgi:hypothetical protein
MLTEGNNVVDPDQFGGALAGDANKRCDGDDERG